MKGGKWFRQENNNSSPHLDQLIMLDPIDSHIGVKRRGHRIPGVDGRVLRDGDVYYSGLEEGRIVIYILDQEADLDQSEDLVRQHSHLNLVVAAFLSEDPGAQLLPVDTVVGGEDLAGVGLHPHQRHVARLVHGLELQGRRQPDAGVQVEVEVLAQVADAYVLRLLLLHRVVPFLGPAQQGRAGEQHHQRMGPTCQVHTRVWAGDSLLRGANCHREEQSASVNKTPHVGRPASCFASLHTCPNGRFST